MDPKGLPKEINKAENQLNHFFNSVEPEPEFANHLETKIIQAIREQRTNQKKLQKRGGQFRFSLDSIKRWGITLAGLGILVVVLIYGINRLIPMVRIPNTSPLSQALPATTIVPATQPTGVLSATVSADNPILTPSGHSWVRVNDENDVNSVNLRSCPSVECAVVGELLAGNKASAVGMVSDGSWFQVEYPDSPDGTAWVYGELVAISGDLPPVVLVLPTPAPFLPAIAPQACSSSGPTKLLLGYLPEHPTRLISGGFVQSGDFIFEIWLGCDSLFGPDAESSNLYSDIPGLGMHLVLSYRGGTEEGEILETWGVRGAGMQPVLGGEGNSTSGMISGSIATHLTGLRIPPELLTNLSQPGEHPLEFVYQARNPQGEWTGAALPFTLVNKPDGFYLTDINIQPLSAQELPTQE